MLKLVQAFEELGVGKQAVADLLAFKATERKDDPARMQGLHGPFEEFTRAKAGRLPEDYFTTGDPSPWGLRIDESRSNILWQVLSGVMDRQPQFAAAYMALALDKALTGDDYAKELGKLHTDWSRYMRDAGAIRDHHHQSMKGIYRSVACPACSMLTAIAVRDPAMHQIFKDMLPLTVSERTQLLHDRGLAPYLKIMIPDVAPPRP